MKNLFLVLIIIFITIDAYACRCRPTDAKTQYSKADIVVMGETIETNTKLIVKVIQSYKGELKVGTSVEALIRNQGMCTSRFKDKTKMFIQFYKEDKKYYAPSNCQRINQQRWREYLKTIVPDKKD